jgi:hypothetical protein
MGLRFRGSHRNGDRSGNQYCAMGGANPIDFGTQDWYTSCLRVCEKCLILLGFCGWRGNPSLSATGTRNSIKSVGAGSRRRSAL